jgi:hypothetical protein
VPGRPRAGSFFPARDVSGDLLPEDQERPWPRARHPGFNVTEHPTAYCTAQQLVGAFPWETARYLLRDRDAVYGQSFLWPVAGLGMA